MSGERVPAIRPIPQGRDCLLADLVARRRKLVGLLVAEKTRKETAPGAVRGMIDPILRAVTQQIQRLEDRIDEGLREDLEQAELLDLVQTVPGVGPAVARRLLVDLPDLERWVGASSLRSSASHPSRATAGPSPGIAASAAGGLPSEPPSTSPS